MSPQDVAPAVEASLTSPLDLQEFLVPRLIQLSHGAHLVPHSTATHSPAARGLVHF